MAGLTVSGRGGRGVGSSLGGGSCFRSLLLVVLGLGLGIVLGAFFSWRLSQLGRLKGEARSLEGSIRGSGGAVAASVVASPASDGLQWVLSLHDDVVLSNETVAVLGHPPLVSRSDVTKDGQPDFENWGLATTQLLPPMPASFVAVEGLELTYARKTEDAIRDVFVAILASPGFDEGAPPPPLALDVDDEGGGGAAPASPPSSSRRRCKASPGASPFWCFASLKAARPAWFSSDAAAASSFSSRVLIVDAGHTNAGYWSLLAASLAASASGGVRVLTVEPQPTCALWARTAAVASGFGRRVRVLNAIPLAAAAGRSQQRTATSTISGGCRGSSTQEGYVPPLSPAGADGSARLVGVPLVSLADAVKEVTPPPAAAALPAAAVILLLKLDARGLESAVLEGLVPLLKEKRVLNVIVELNKHAHEATVAAAAARSKQDEGGEEGTERGPLHSQALLQHAMGGGVGLSVEAAAAPVSAAADAAAAAAYAALVRMMLAHGFEMLTSDRGWWAAQDSFKPPGALNTATGEPFPGTAPGDERVPDGTTLETWAAKVSPKSEIDVWFFLPATDQATLPL